MAEKGPQTVEGLWDLWCFCVVERSINTTQAAFLTCWVNLLYMVCAVCVCECKCWAVVANKRRLPLSDMLKGEKYAWLNVYTPNKTEPSCIHRQAEARRGGMERERENGS